jgi:uncharacterized membrane protein
MADSPRIDALEDAVARLSTQVHDLQVVVRALSPPAAAGTAADAIARTQPPAAMSAANPDLTLGMPSQVPAGPHDDEAASPLEQRLRPLAMPNAAAEATSRQSSGPGERSTRAEAVDAGHWPPLPAIDVEKWVGRYGTLGLASLTILMGVGAFLGWAVRNGLIGPVVRVALGAVAAAVLAGAGWRLRRRDGDRFGWILLALALAVVHVDAWGAGVLLHVVPAWVALTVAAVASAGLAAVALRDEEQSLFNVGFGGALLAPFVTSSGRADVTLLLIYGYVVIAAGMVALRGREWDSSPFLYVLGIGVYTAAAAAGAGVAPSWTLAHEPVFFALGVAWTALAVLGTVHRMRVAHASLLAALAALAYAVEARDRDVAEIAFAAMITVTGLLSAFGGDAGLRAKLVTGLLLPLGSLVAAEFVVPAGNTVARVAVAAGWAVGSIGASVIGPLGLRNVHAMVGALIGGFAVYTADRDASVARVIALSAYGVAATLVLVRARLPGIVMASTFWLAVAAMQAFGLLWQRPQFRYTPFGTSASLAAAAASAAWLFFSWHAYRALADAPSPNERQGASLLRVAGAVVAFLWIRQELRGAYSPEQATFLLIAYYAVAGVAGIFIGRARGIPLFRNVGLGLAIFAALKAVAQATDLAIGWRIGGYLLAGVFMLGVAYWYRRTRD